MKITITETDGSGGRFLVDSKDAPEIGRSYYMEDATSGTGAQNRAFHALVQEYWKSGLHPKYGGDPFDQFRDSLKRDLGEGFEKYVYADIEQVEVDTFQPSHEERYKPVIKEVKTYEEIPEEIRNDPTGRIMGRLKSWTAYTLKQRRRLIDNLIDDMVAAGVDSKKFQEILEGMNDEKGS